MGKTFYLRPHHAQTLATGNCTSVLDYGIMPSINKSQYAEQDLQKSKQLYTDISSDPKNIVVMVGGEDDICRACSNNNNGSCRSFGSELEIEDRRTLRDFFPNLKIGDKVKVADLKNLIDLSVVWNAAHPEDSKPL